MYCKLVFISFFSLLNFVSFAKDIIKLESDSTKTQKHWKFENKSTLYISQNAYSEYWKGSGYNNLAFGGEVDWKALYKKEKSSFNFQTNIQYGLMKRDDQELIKNRDKLEIRLNYNYNISENFSFSGLTNMRTFTSKTYKLDKDGMKGNYVGRFLSPLTLDLGTGINWKTLTNKKNENNKLDVYYTPLNSKITVVRDSSSAIQYLPEKNRQKRYRVELGSLVKVVFAYELVKNVILESRADFFTSHIQNFGNFDFNIEGNMRMKVNKQLSVDILGSLVYDEDIQFDILDADGSDTGKKGPRTQFSESINFGITHSF